MGRNTKVYIDSMVKYNYNRRRIIFIVILLLFISKILLQYSFVWGTPLFEGRFEPGQLRGVEYILQHNRILPEEEIRGTYIAQIGIKGDIFYPRDVLFGVIGIIVGMAGHEDIIKFSQYFPIQTFVLFPLFGVTIYRSLAHKKNINNSGRDIIVILLFSLFGSTFFSGGFVQFHRMSLFSWSFVLLFFYSLFKIHSESSTFRFLIINIISLYGILSYKFTVGLMFLIILGIILSTKVFRSYCFNYRPHFFNHIIIITIVSCIYMYYRYNYILGHRFESIVLTIIEFLRLEFFSGAAVGGSSAVSVFKPLPTILHLIELALPGVFFLAIFVDYIYNRNGYNQIILSMYSSLPFLAIGFFLWKGAWDVFFRVSQIYAITSIVSLSYVLNSSYRDGNMIRQIRLVNIHQVITLIVILSVVASTSVLLIGNESQYTVEEKEAFDWVGKNVDSDSSVFSDQRLGTYLIFYDFYNIQVINGIEYPRDFIKLHQLLVLHPSKENIRESQSIFNSYGNIPPEYYIISEKFENDKYVTIDPLLRPNPNLRTTYDKISTVSKIYSNGGSSVYAGKV